MERADDGVVQSDRRVDVDALLHLGGGAFGEGDGEDLVRLRRARSDEVDDACCQNMRLPRPSTSDYEQWTETVLDG